LHLLRKVSLTKGAVLTFNYNYENYYSGPYSLAQRHLRSGWEGWGLTALALLLALIHRSSWNRYSPKFGISKKGLDTWATAATMFT
jgi:hypothetical protein